MSRVITVHAPAKVNLALAVGGLRRDGYHDVRTVLQAIALGDQVTLEPADGLELVCDVPDAGQGPANLGWRAAERLRQAAGIAAGVRIRIIKRIPLQAGLGGGLRGRGRGPARLQPALAVAVACGAPGRIGGRPRC